MAPKSGSSLITLTLILTLVNSGVGQTTFSPQQAVAADKRQQLVRSNTSSDLKESADSSGHPSITSVHQVWTSTSSGRLDELSPEMIGKLRNDVPFLAAYALRPRLVGAITSQPSGAIQPLGSYVSSQIQQPPSSETLGSTQKQDLIAKLGDFSELNVETSSLSKSEHLHKRKTSLKRQKAAEGRTNKELKRRVLETTSRLVKGNKGGTKSSKTKVLRPSVARAGRLRRKLARGNLQHHMNIIKHGRLQADVNNKDEGVKGGGDGKKRTPFYSRSGDKRMNKDEENSSTNEAENRKEAGESRDDQDNDASRIEGEDGELEQPRPRRVGDGDVDEVEGDTVTVMPKFDGVGDDPELPESLPDDDDAPTGEAGGDGSTTNESSEPEGDVRGNRVNRERPLEGEGEGGQVLGGGIGTTTGGGAPSSGSGPSAASGGSENSNDSTEGSSSGGKALSDTKPGVEFANGNKEGRDGSSSAGSSDAGGKDSNDPNEDADAADGEGNDSERKRFRGKPVGADEESNRDSKSGEKPKKDDEDLDYRDDDEDDVKRRKTSDGSQMKVSTGEHESRSHRKDCDDGSYNHHDDHHHHHHDNHHDSIKWLEDAVAGKPGYDYPIFSRANATNFKCRDQKYPGYYADVEARCQVFHICQADGRQDSFLCPNGTIFSQKTTVCVWWNSFDCEDAPKYYDLNALLYKTAPQSAVADDSGVAMSDLKPRDLPPKMGSRKDGSKLDEDEDEEFSIDGLIKAMKRRNQNGGGRMEIERMLPDGGKRTGAQDKADDDEGGANDASQPKTKPSAPMGTIEPNDDEANTIQRKTPASAVEAADEQEEGAVESNDGRGSSRLRRLGKSKAEPRKRRRRASVRQSPPKLTSRRYSRVSRRWKLRHAPKPKRRA